MLIKLTGTTIICKKCRTVITSKAYWNPPIEKVQLYICITLIDILHLLPALVSCYKHFSFTNTFLNAVTNTEPFLIIQTCSHAAFLVTSRTVLKYAEFQNETETPAFVLSEWKQVSTHMSQICRCISLFGWFKVSLCFIIMWCVIHSTWD